MRWRAGLVLSVAAVLVAVLVAGTTALVTAAVLRDDRPGTGFGHAAMAGRSMHASSVDTEYAFLAEMVAHHAEAVAAAGELERSERPEMREFGETIIASQSAQIDQMKQWLGDWYPERSGRVDYDPMMRDLGGLSGDRLDRAFLQDMIGHHMGAVMMSQQLLARGVADHPEVERLAETIRDEQHEEIFRMQRWLREWFDTGWQHGMRHGGPRR